jgi:hypothetical protein
MEPIDPKNIVWDPPPEPVGTAPTGSATEPLRGGIIIPAKPEKPEKPPARLPFATSEQKIAAGLNPNVAYQVNEETNEFKLVPGQETAKSAAPTDPDRVRKLNAWLDSIETVRKLATKQTTGRTAGQLAEGPVTGLFTGQDRTDLEATIATIEAGIMQDQIALLAELNKGGVGGIANTPEEARRLAAAIANLTPSQSVGLFKGNVDRAEAYFLKQLEIAGGTRETAKPSSDKGEKTGEEAKPVAAGEEAQPTFMLPQPGQPIQTQSDLTAEAAYQKAWDQGASVDEIIALGQLLGRGGPEGPFDAAAIQQMREARAAGRQIKLRAAPTGEQTDVQEFMATDVGKKLGGAAVGAVTGVTLGTAKDIIPGFGDVEAAYGQEVPLSTAIGQAAGLIGAGLPISNVAKAALPARFAGTTPLIGETLAAGTFGYNVAPEGQELQNAAISALGAAGAGALANRFLPGAPGTWSGMARAEPPTAGITAGMIPEGPPSGPTPPPAGGMAAGIAPDGTPPPTGGMAAEVPPTEDTTELGTIILDAIGTGKKAKAAKIKLAEMAQINLEAKAAAERLGIEVPADVFSDNPQIRAAIGALRSQVASEDEAAWRTVVSNAVDQADNVMRDFDAQFVEGTVAPGLTSERVRDNLMTTRSALNKQAKAIYDEVDAVVPDETPVQMNNLSALLDKIEKGVGKIGLTAQEERLKEILKSGNVTYGFLRREKTQIGKARRREESTFGSADEKTLTDFEAAFVKDQLDNVNRVAGEEARRKLRGANLIYAKERALAKRIVNAFGEDLLGGIARKMTGAIKESAQGDPGAFTRLMKAVPKDLRKEVVATALAAASRSNQGAQKGAFGFSEFAALYPKLRANPPVYKQIVQALGPKSADALRDLYQVSKRITEARANVLTTGKANQLPIIQQLRTEKLMAKVMDSAAAKRTVGAAIGMTGPFAPIIGAVTPDILEAMSKGSPDAVAAAGKMFASPEFESLAIELATKPEVSKKAINRVAMSKRFREFAKQIGLNPKDGSKWLRSAITSTAGGIVRGVAGIGAAGPQEEQPTQPEGEIMESPRQ